MAVVQKDDRPELHECLESSNSYNPTKSELQTGQAVLHSLSKALLGDGYRQTISQAFPDLHLRYYTIDSVTIGLIPLNFYAWELWKPNETIEVCVAGTPSEKTFHSLARSRFRNASDIITIERGDKSEGTFNLQISTIKINLRYHQNALISRWSEVNEADVQDVMKSLPWHSRERVGELTHTQQVANQLHLQDVSFDIIRKAYFSYREWAVNTGFYPQPLTPEHLLVLSIHQIHARQSFQDVARLNLPIPSATQPLVDTACELGLEKFRFRDSILRSIIQIMAHWNADELCLKDFTASCWPDMLTLWPLYIRIDVRYWGSSRIAAAKWLKAVDAARRGLMFKLNQHMLYTTFHPWPTPFVEQDPVSWSFGGRPDKPRHMPHDMEEYTIRETAEAAAKNSNFELSYFIGVRLSNSRSIHQNSMSSEFVLKAFRDSFHWDNPSDVFFNAYICGLSHVGVKLNRFIPYPLPIPEDTRKLDLDSDNEDDDPQITESNPTASSKANLKKQAKSKSIPSLQTASKPSAFLRPAADVLHRIRYDSSYQTDDFLIGYLDRHTGVKEIPFDWWTEENTAEEFIPQSRIRYFKRKLDGVVVWDRERRIDLVFGTGAAAGNTDAEGGG